MTDKIIIRFKQALQYMIDNGELDRIDRNVKGRERRAARKDAELLRYLAGKYDLEQLPFIMLLHEIQSAEILKDALVCMTIIPDEAERSSETAGESEA